MEKRCACVREKKVCTDKFRYYVQEGSCITKCVHIISHSTYVCRTVCLFVCVFLQIYFSIDQMNKVSPAREAPFTSKRRCLDPSLFMPFFFMYFSKMDENGCGTVQVFLFFQFVYLKFKVNCWRRLTLYGHQVVFFMLQFCRCTRIGVP